MKHTFNIGEFDTEHEAAFAYNVAALVLEGADAELNEGLDLTLERKQQIEAQVLRDLRAYLELPATVKWGKFPRLYA